MQPKGFQFTSLIGLVLLTAGSVGVRANSTQSKPSGSLHDRLVSAAYNSSLDGSGLKPWHLKLEATFYDADGKNPYSGTIERWQSGDDSRTTITVGAATSTTLHSDGKFYTAQSGPDVPALTDFILDAALHPGPAQGDIENAALELRKEGFGKVKLDCVMLSQPIADASAVPTGLFPTYCLDPESGDLRASYNFGSFTILRNGIGDFQGKQVSTDISFMQGNILLAQAKTGTLQTFMPSDQFKPDATMKQSASPMTTLTGGLMKGMVLSRVQPIYPVSARRDHISGTVKLLAIIGRDGHIYYLRLLSTPDVDLAISAITAVRHWVYQPYRYHGEATEVQTTITVNYNMGAADLRLAPLESGDTGEGR